MKYANKNYELFTYLMEETNLAPTDIIDIMLKISDRKRSRKEKINKIYDLKFEL